MATEEYHFYVALLAPRGLGPIAAGLHRDWHTIVYVSGCDGTNYLVNNHEDLKLEKGFGDGEDYIFSSFFRGPQETALELFARLSGSLSHWKIEHSMEVYDEEGDEVAYLHFCKPRENT